MCGIAGVISLNGVPVDASKTEGLIEVLKHRGPDGAGSYIEDVALIVHTRLSIIDLSASGSQPMFSEDKKIVTVVNGEIYNFKELRYDLESKGHNFIGNSDAEIVPHLYEEYGNECIPMLKGMFSLAIWDTINKKGIIVRDRFGIKPLYFYKNEDFLFFGSELKAILLHPEVPRLVDLQDIHDYLSLCYVPEPKTGFKDIYALDPGYYLEFNTSGKCIKKCYWNIDDYLLNTNPNESNAKMQLESLLDVSVARQMVADAPLGAFLSGGIDSSAVVTTMRKVSKNLFFKTFTVKFPDKDFDESAYAAQIAKIVQTDHRELSLNEGKGDYELIKKLLEHFDQPFGDSSCIPTFLICNEIKKEVKVALSGDGGDEILSGYLNFIYFKKIISLRSIPKVIRNVAKYVFSGLGVFVPNYSRKLLKAIRLSNLSDVELVTELNSYMTEQEKQIMYKHAFSNTLSQKAVIPTSHVFEEFIKFKNIDLSKRMSRMLFKTSLPSEMFKKVDMMSMLSAIEVRVPLMDEELVEYSISLPESLKIQNGKGKWILRKILKQRLPENIVDKRKTGFSIPLDKMANPDFMKFLYDMLLGEDSNVSKLVKQEVIRDWLDAFEGKKKLSFSISREGVYQRLFMLLSLEVWFRKYEPKW